VVASSRFPVGPPFRKNDGRAGEIPISLRECLNSSCSWVDPFHTPSSALTYQATAGKRRALSRCPPNSKGSRSLLLFPPPSSPLLGTSHFGPLSVFHRIFFLKGDTPNVLSLWTDCCPPGKNFRPLCPPDSHSPGDLRDLPGSEFPPRVNAPPSRDVGSERANGGPILLLLDADAPQSFQEFFPEPQDPADGAGRRQADFCLPPSSSQLSSIWNWSSLHCHCSKLQGPFARTPEPATPPPARAPEAPVLTERIRGAARTFSLKT
jgi:hypothetical protein